MRSIEENKDIYKEVDLDDDSSIGDVCMDFGVLIITVIFGIFFGIYSYTPAYFENTNCVYLRSWTISQFYFHVVYATLSLALVILVILSLCNIKININIFKWLSYGFGFVGFVLFYIGLCVSQSFGEECGTLLTLVFSQIIVGGILLGLIFIIGTCSIFIGFDYVLDFAGIKKERPVDRKTKGRVQKAEETKYKYGQIDSSSTIKTSSNILI